jgi:hypothetical protein
MIDTQTQQLPFVQRALDLMWLSERNGGACGCPGEHFVFRDCALINAIARKDDAKGNMIKLAVFLVRTMPPGMVNRALLWMFRRSEGIHFSSKELNRAFLERVPEVNLWMKFPDRKKTTSFRAALRQRLAAVGHRDLIGLLDKKLKQFPVDYDKQIAALAGQLMPPELSRVILGYAELGNAFKSPPTTNGKLGIFRMPTDAEERKKSTSVATYVCSMNTKEKLRDRAEKNE